MSQKTIKNISCLSYTHKTSSLSSKDSFLNLNKILKRNLWNSWNRVPFFIFGFLPFYFGFLPFLLENPYRNHSFPSSTTPSRLQYGVPDVKLIFQLHVIESTSKSINIFGLSHTKKDCLSISSLATSIHGDLALLGIVTWFNWFGLYQVNRYIHQ